LAINGCNQEERHRRINPVSPDSKGLGTVVVGMMPPYDDRCLCNDNDNDDDDNNNGFAGYLATGAVPPPPTLLSLLSLLLIGKKNWGKKRGN
jgi:hypothetical protein